ncbi:MAG TPA: hypothetical protein VFT06_00280 [Flavisolibacter sp.]|nr:hypothetical protein [Flavisolibacter sp.]
MSDQIQVEEKKEVTGTTVISISKPTPMWATWMFRIVFLLTTAAVVIIAGDPVIKDETKVRVMLYLKGFDVVIWGIARGLGVDKKQFEE